MLRVADLLDTLTTEAVIHHLDLVLDLPDAPLPGPAATRVAVATVDALLGGAVTRPDGWNDHDYLLKATGRLPLTEPERRAAGEFAARFPVLG